VSQSRGPRCIPDVVDSRALEAITVPVMTGVSRPAAPVRRMPTGFERLFIEEYPRIAAIAGRVLADQAAAEDVAQEVFLDLHRRFGDDPGANAPAWLRAAAVHTALNTIRARHRRAARELRYTDGGDAGRDPEAALEAAETGRLVRAALARIPRRHAAVLALRYSGLSYTEMASALGVGVNTVGTRLRRAEARLRKEVGDASL